MIDMVFVALVGEQLGHALLIYPLVWLMVRRKGAGPFTISKFNWHLAGYVATGIGAGFIQFHAISFSSVQGVLDPQSLVVEGIYVLVLPALFAVGSCYVIKHKTGYYSTGQTG